MQVITAYAASHKRGADAPCQGRNPRLVLLSEGGDDEITLKEYRLSRTYRALTTHLSRTYHALNFACNFVGIIYIVYNTGVLL